MTLIQSLLYKLRTVEGLHSIRERFKPQQAPQDWKPPYAIYTRITHPRLKNLQADDGLSHPTYRFTIYGKTYAEADTLATAFRAVSGFRGEMGDHFAQALFVEDVADEFDTPIDGSERGTNSVTLDVILWAQE